MLRAKALKAYAEHCSLKKEQEQMAIAKTVSHAEAILAGVLGPDLAKSATIEGEIGPHDRLVYFLVDGYRFGVETYLDEVYLYDSDGSWLVRDLARVGQLIAEMEDAYGIQRAA